jgi:hypothetical protein
LAHYQSSPDHWAVFRFRCHLSVREEFEAFGINAPDYLLLLSWEDRENHELRKIDFKSFELHTIDCVCSDGNVSRGEFGLCSFANWAIRVSPLAGVEPIHRGPLGSLGSSTPDGTKAQAQTA